MARLCALSVNLDPIALYHQLHDLPAPEPEAAARALDLALDRFLEFAREERVPLTFFVVARELERAPFAARLSAAASAGHELANHTLEHRYDLARLPRETQREQVAAARELIERKLGVLVQGFRAPGYVVTDELLELVARTGHVYDSSVLPSPAFHAARELARAGLAFRRRDPALVGEPRQALRAPTRPYRLGTPSFRSGDGLVELPIQVTRGLRLPYTGTGLALAGRLGARVLTELVLGEPLVNLGFHTLDLLDEHDGLAALRGFRPDVRLSVAHKRRVFSNVVRRLARAGYELVTLGRAAARVR